MALTKISASVIAANAIVAAGVAENSISTSEIATDGVGTLQISDGAVTSGKLDTNIDIAGNLTVSGNLVTNGATVTNSSTNTTIEDNLIELGTGTTGSPSSDSGIVIERGDSDNAFIGWDESEDKFILGTGSFTGASTGNLTITTAPLVVGALTTSGLSFPTSDGTNGQVLKTDGSGSLTFGDNTTKVDNYTATGDGSTTAFDTGINPGSEVNTWIFIDGVYQQKSEYSYSGSTVTFTTAPQNGASIDVITGTSSNITASDTVLGVYEATTTNTDTYATGISASNENNTWVFVGGVYQPKDSYTFSSGTLTFDANTPTGQKLSVVATKTITAGAVDTSTLAANAVTSAKIASNSILSRHIANNSIVGADISATTQITASTFTGALTGDVTGNVVGNLTGTIQTAAQTNITSVGTLSALTVSGQLTAGGLSYPTSDGTNEQVLRTDGSGNLSFGTISGTTINNNTNNYVMTGTGTANTLNGESGLIFDGTNLGIGVPSPSEKLSILGGHISVGDSTGVAGTEFLLEGYREVSGGSKYGNTSIRTTYDTGSNASDMLFYTASGGTNTAEAMRIDSSGDLTVGASSVANCTIGNDGDLINIKSKKDGTDAIPLTFITQVSGGILAEAMRIDSSQNLLVGYNNTNLNTSSTESGHNFFEHGYAVHSRDGQTVMTINRLSNDGDIVDFRKDGSVVGSIGSWSQTGSSRISMVNPNGNGLGIFRETSTFASIVPITNGASGDGAHGLGRADYRWKDLYLSGGAYLGGTGSANHLDDYEEGTWTPSGSLTSSVYYATYTKIGRVVTIAVHMFFNSSTNTATADNITGLPFSVTNSTDSAFPLTIWKASAGGNTNYDIQAHVYQNESRIRLTAVGGAAKTYAEISNGYYLIGGSYFTDS